MKYLKVEWHHDFSDEPKVTYSEVGTNGYESRKVEVFPDNSYGFSSEEISSSKTFLSDLPFPDDIASNDEFTPTVITREKFEEVWSRACSHKKSLWARFIDYIKAIFFK